MSAGLRREAGDALDRAPVDRSNAIARFPALGSTAVVMVTDPASLASARVAVQQIVEEFDRACSRFATIPS